MKTKKIYHEQTIDDLTAKVIKAYSSYSVRLHNDHGFIVERGPFFTLAKAVSDIPNFVARQSEAKARTGCYTAEI